MRLTVTLVILGCCGGSAFSQYPPGYQYPFAPAPYGLNYLPNFYNRQTQPLSPYLNLLRGGNPGVNYFYGVRPGLPSGGMMPNNASMNQLALPGQSQLRQGFLPSAALPNQDIPELPLAGEKIQLLPSSHPVYFQGATTFVRPNATALRPGVLGNRAPAPYQPSRPGGRQRP